MKLLFNIEDGEISADELKELLGFFDADVTFKNLLPDIISGTNEVKKIIGQEVYNYLFVKYTNALAQGVYTNDYTDSDSNLIRSTRYPIALRAYALFAPINDLSHSNDGRRMRNGEFEKQAFQWQIDADNKAQEKRFFRALDDLFELLDNSKPTNYNQIDETAKKESVYYKWTNSDACKKLKSLFLNTVDAFNEIFIIESRLLLLKLSSGMDECERREILPRIGAVKFKALKEAEPTEAKDIELLRLIKQACAFYALAWAIPRMSITHFPEGILQYKITDKQGYANKAAPMLNEHEYALQAFKISATRALDDIEELVRPLPEPSLEPLEPIIRTCEDKFFSAT